MPSHSKPLLTLALLASLALAACGGNTVGTSNSAAESESTSRQPVNNSSPSFVVMAIQESLDVLGYEVGPIDGLAGETSRTALRMFQEDSGLEPSGLLDGDSIVALAEASDESQHFVVEAVQTQLAELGYFQGLVDGGLGPETEAALQEFHDAEGLEGDIGTETLTRLGDVYVADVVIPTLEANGYEAPPAQDPADGLLRQGDEGDDVQAIQERLAALGYRPGTADGRFGGNTTSAVLAFQKREGLGRDGVIGPSFMAALEDPSGAGPTSTNGPRIEVDLDRQIAFIVNGSGGVTTINISSGSGREYTEPDGGTSVAYTPTGDFAVERMLDEVREAPLGSLYRPIYFKDGWAVHGSPNVPAYPASHGCIRTSNYDQDFVFPLISVGDVVSIYGESLGEPGDGAPGF